MRAVLVPYVAEASLLSGRSLAVFQHIYYHQTGEIYVGHLVSEVKMEDRCLTDPGNGEKPALEPCSTAAQRGLHIHWDFKQVSHVPFKGEVDTSAV